YRFSNAVPSNNCVFIIPREIHEAHQTVDLVSTDWPPETTVIATVPIVTNDKIALLGDRYGSEMHASKITTSTAARRLDCSDVDLSHFHHRIERALGGSGIGDRFRQGDRRNLPGQSPFVLAPAARALLAAVADDRVPVAIRFGLVSGCDLKRERFVVLARGTAIEPE